MKIIDAHHHLWDINLHDYPWLKKDSKNPLSKNYLIDDFEKDIGKLEVVKSVHVQGEMNHQNSLDETKWLQEISDKESSNKPNAIVAYEDLTSSKLIENLENQKIYKNLRGIRQILNYSETDSRLNIYDGVDKNFLTDEKWLSGFSILSKYNLSFDLQVWPSQLLKSYELAKDFPESLIILNHTGCPLLNNKKNDENEWHEGMKKLSESENIAVKISGLFMRGNPGDKYLEEIIKETINLFGVNRCFFASNFPVDSLKITYKDLWDYFLEVSKNYTATEKEKLFNENAASYYRI
tara:strand:- start:4569 stop:5450 length:882 start_codon:yes stop_codon:yes gene_type:complete